jgi:hypothetical protein
MLIASKLPKSLWGYALMYATWLKNRIPHKALENIQKTPYELVFGEKPNLEKAKEWGCKVFVNVKNDDKLGARGRKGRYLGPSSETTDGFNIYWPGTGRVTVERNIRFLDGCAFEGERRDYLDVATTNPFENQSEERTKIVENASVAADVPPTYTSVVPTVPAAPKSSSNTSQDQP